MQVVNETGVLGEFLKSRRDRRRPEDVGLSTIGRRRVPGLRREELAALAGVSAAYLTRLEQGTSARASESVLVALAKALGLTRDETDYLLVLGGARATTPTHPERTAALRPALEVMLEAVRGGAAYVVSPYGDVLGWNSIAHWLIAPHLPFAAPTERRDRPNTHRMLFLSEAGAALFVDWEARARDAVAALRHACGHRPNDATLRALVDELALGSDDFARLWSVHEAGRCSSRIERYLHADVGPLTLREEVLDLPHDEGQRLILIAADPGSDDELTLLTRGLGKPDQSTAEGMVASN